MPLDDDSGTQVSDTPPDAPAELQAAPSRLADLLTQVETVVLRYVRLRDPPVVAVLAIWVAHTYLYERFKYTPYLSIQSAMPRCGKSRLLELLALFSKGRPPVMACPTAAVLFRRPPGPLFLDEVDTLRSSDRTEHGTIIQILNHGYVAGGVVERTEQTSSGGWSVRRFPVFWPKCFAGLE